MPARLKIGISLSPDAITAAIGGLQKSTLALKALLRLPLPRGSIDSLTGRVACDETLLATLEKLCLSDRLTPRCASISMAIPSSSVYVHTWMEDGVPKPLSQAKLRQRLDRLFPGKSEELIFDIHKNWVASQSYTQFMLVVVNREVVKRYVRLLGPRAPMLVRVTTAEIARYAACCGINSSIAQTPAVVVSTHSGYLQATTWKEGIICDSRSILVSDKPGSGEQQMCAQAEALTSLLGEALARCSESERAVCKVVVCYGAPHALVEQSVRALALGPLPVEHIAVTPVVENNNNLVHRLLRTFKGEVTQGMEDALGLVMLGDTR